VPTERRPAIVEEVVAVGLADSPRRSISAARVLIAMSRSNLRAVEND
jgi:hypothetical protein